MSDLTYSPSDILQLRLNSELFCKRIFIDTHCTCTSSAKPWPAHSHLISKTFGFWTKLFCSRAACSRLSLCFTACLLCPLHKADAMCCCPLKINPAMNWFSWWHRGAVDASHNKDHWIWGRSHSVWTLMCECVCGVLPKSKVRWIGPKLSTVCGCSFLNAGAEFRCQTYNSNINYTYVSPPPSACPSSSQ